MRRRQRARQDDIRQILRQGDPAADGHDLRPEEAARMRRRIGAEPAVDTVPALRPIPILAAAAALVLALAIFWLSPTSDVVVAPRETAVTERSPPGPARQTRQVHFSTPGGTRIIWLLDSEFDV